MLDTRQECLSILQEITDMLQTNIDEEQFAMKMANDNQDEVDYWLHHDKKDAYTYVMGAIVGIMRRYQEN